MTPLRPPFGHPRANRKGFVPRNPILGTVVDFTVTPGNGQMVMEWSHVVGALGYQRQYKPASEGTWIDHGEPEPYYTAPPSVQGLTNDLEYDGRVIALDNFTQTTSNEDSATPVAPSTELVVDDLAVSDETQSDELSFTFTQCGDGTGNPASYACRIRSPDISTETWGQAFDSQVYIDTDLAIGVEKTVVFEGLAAGTTYQAMLIPFRGPTGSAEEFGEFTDPVSGTTSGSAALGTISDLAPFPGDAQVGLVWTPAVNATFHQPRFNPDGAGYEDFGSPLGAGVGNVTVDGLTNADPHAFIIRAGDGSTTTDSNEVEATPQAAGERLGEPGGMTQLITTNDFLTGTLPGAAGWQLILKGPDASIVADATSPGVGDNVMQITYNQGISGSSDTDFIMNQADFPSNTQHLYFDYHFKPSSNFEGHQSGRSKLGYFGSGSDGAGLYLTMVGVDLGTLKLSLSNQSQSQVGDGTRNFNWNDGDNTAGSSSSDADITRGQWNRVQVYARMNDAGQQNGRLWFYLNGVLVGAFNPNGTTNDPDFDFWKISQGGRFWGRWKNSAIWGGLNDTVDATMYIRYAGIYISGKA
jgi:hypothetical protein